LRSKTASAARDNDWAQLSARPGFLIRRLHQIHVALFIEECSAENVTPVQYSVLSELQQHDGSDQTALGHAVALDRANVADVLDRLEKRGLLCRRVSPLDKRMRLVTLTPAGRALLTRLEAKAIRAHERTVEALPPAERQRFIRNMLRLVTAKNDVGRATLRVA
jgi:DNA-binding MarR family transcriptional regulator